MFKAGDMVVVVMPGEDIDGLRGEVLEIDEDQLWPVKVRLFAPGYGRLIWVFNLDELEILDD